VAIDKTALLLKGLLNPKSVDTSKKN
jgi:hypothetical protein